MSRFTALVLAFALLPVSQAADWRDYGGTPDQSKYARTPDITKKNVARLAVSWTYPTGDERT